MKSKQIMFFATENDLTPIIKEVEAAYQIKYYKDEFIDTPKFDLYNSAFEIPDLAFTEQGDWNLSTALFVVPKNTTLSIREIPQRKGGIKYEINESVNIDNIEFKPSGIFKDASNIIVAGRIATISQTDFSQQLFKSFASNIKKNFSKIEEFYVGKEAEEKLKSGWRLVTNEKLSTGFDLKIIK